MTTACLVVAAGAGTRLAAGAPKAFVKIAGGRLLDLAVERVLASGAVDGVVVVVPNDRVGQVARHLPDRVVAVAGGATRQDSVRAGLAVIGASTDIVLVHDAARCLTPPSLIADVVAAVRTGHPVVVPGVAVHDTVRMIDANGRPGHVVDRSALRAVQTPQGFTRAVLEDAHAHPLAEATDDATMAEARGHAVHVIPGSELAFKVTRPVDLTLAAALLRGASATVHR